MGFQPAPLARVQLRPNFIHIELDYTEPHKEDNEPSSFHKRIKTPPVVYLHLLTKQSQTIQEGFVI